MLVAFHCNPHFFALSHTGRCCYWIRTTTIFHPIETIPRTPKLLQNVTRTFYRRWWTFEKDSVSNWPKLFPTPRHVGPARDLQFDFGANMASRQHGFRFVAATRMHDGQQQHRSTRGKTKTVHNHGRSNNAVVIAETALGPKSASRWALCRRRRKNQYGRWPRLGGGSGSSRRVSFTGRRDN